MAHIKPWLDVTDAQVTQACALVERFNAAQYNPSRLYGSISTTSRMLQSEWRHLRDFHTGSNRSYFNVYNAVANTPEEQYLGRFENAILTLLCALHPTVANTIKGLINIKDRSNTNRNDPLSTTTITTAVGMAYLPKGITDFNPPDKTLDEILSAKIQREIIRENGNDPLLPANHDDKKITVKVFKDTRFIHFYFNKRSIHTIRRMWYKAIHAAWFYLNLSQYCEAETEELNCIVNDFCYPVASSAENILRLFNKIIEQRIQVRNENLIPLFCSAKQTAMNESRKQALERNLADARRHYENNVSQYAMHFNNLIQARKAMSEFSEVEFTAVTVFLTKIKDYPRTQSFNKINETLLQFCIEEPMLHTDPKTWSRYIENQASDLNNSIGLFTRDYREHYNTTRDILRFALQRLFKETFVDGTIRLYTSALLGIQSDRTDFTIEKFSFATSGNFMPHPHIATTSLTCWGEAQREITKRIMENDGETAFLQLTYALQQMTASDSVVLRKLIEMVLNSRYRTVTIYQRKNNPERTSFENIIKEFVQNETDKINAIREADLEGEPSTST